MRGQTREPRRGLHPRVTPDGTAGGKVLKEMISIRTLFVIALASAPVRAEDVAGHWIGRMEPTRLSAEIELEFRRADGPWTAEMTFRAGADGGPLPIEELRVAGDSVFVRTKIEGADVGLALAREDDLLLGSVRVTENGRLLAEGPVGLARALATDARERLASWLDSQVALVDAAQRGAVIERCLELLTANYVFPDRAERAAAEVRERSRRGEYESITGAARFAELLGRHLFEATGDRHIRVKIGSERSPDPLDDAVETKEDLAQLRRDAEVEGYGIGAARVLDGNVGYLEIERFFRAELAGDALAAAMQRLSGTDALIVDLRECRGGDPVMSVLVASWFFDGRPRHWNDMLRRRDGTTTQFWTAAWLPGPRYADKPVYVLTSARTFSAPESLAFELQQTKRATILGEVTGGGAHSGAWLPVDDRFALFVPLSRYVSAVSGGDWEGTGVTPDILCDASEAQERAHRIARDALGREK